MTLSTTQSSETYAGDDVTVAFPVPFPFFTNGDITVTLVSGATETLWVEGTDYSLSGAGSGSGTVTATTAPGDGESLVIQRQVALTQDTDLPDSGPFLASTVEQSLDRTVMIAQQQQTRLARAFTVPVGDGATGALTLPAATARADKLFGFDGDGDPVMTTGDAALTDGDDILEIDNGGNGLDATLRPIADRSGTAGPLALSTADIRISGSGDPNLFYTDHSANEVGIGTDTPDGKFHIHAGSAGAVTANAGMDCLVAEDSSAVGMTFLSPNTVSAHIAFGDPEDADAGRITYQHNNDHMLFLTSGVERLRLDDAGNLGIGESVPEGRLHVADINTSVVIEDNDGGTVAGPDLVLYRKSSSPQNDDALARVKFDGRDNGANQTSYGEISARIVAATGGAESGALLLSTLDAGSAKTLLHLDAGQLRAPSLPTAPAGLADDALWQTEGLAHIGPAEGQLGGYRNALINGDMRIAQRGTSFSLDDEAVYTLDRWICNTGPNGAATISQVQHDFDTFLDDHARMLRWQQTTAADVQPALKQRIEGVRRFHGRTVTISFTARVSTGTLSVLPALRQIFGTGGSPSAANQKNAPAVTVTTTATRFSRTLTLDPLTTETVGTNGDDALELLFALPASSTFTMDITDIQVESGSAAHRFERRPAGLERALCRHYFERLDSDGAGAGKLIGAGWALAAGQADFPLIYAPKRRTPTITVSAGTDFLVFERNTSEVSTGFSCTRVGRRSALAAVTVAASGLAAGEGVAVGFNNTLGFIDIDAELV